MQALVQSFCKAFEKANSASNLPAIADLYAETFLFAGPAGARPVNREDLLKVIPGMKARLASLGLASTRLSSVEATNLDSNYVLAKVEWSMAVLTSNGDLKNISAQATYVLQLRDDSKLSIVFQLDHQDLSTVISNERNG